MKIKKYEEINSTHKYLKENYKKYENKTVIIAERQTAGIGTKGSSWYTGTNKNIAMSILYKPSCKISQLKGLTIEIAKILQKDIEELYNIKLEIKEPNDLMLNHKKISGILTEINTLGEKINYLIISIGFNVNETDFTSEIAEIATSLKKEYERDFDKEKIIKKFIESLENIVN